ncbi:plasmid maintenance protein CcdB [Pseudidiomarina aestuarii]|uniref:Toxin CcdB n=1 Tax=Pseudidiomarina aestuarii TaxID=624146 RepID=A0A6N4DI44_9GAMM|nr:plasmid maintenance protein CcdB [Pseudidiomarina aestuarii]
MGQFFAYQNPNPQTQRQYPYLLDIQNDLLSELRTTIVIPLSPTHSVASMRLTRLNPTVSIENESFTVMTQDIAGIDRNQLGTKAFNLSNYRADIMAAVDFVLSGF